MKQTNPKIAVVTGANKGLGLETVGQLVQKGYKVFLSSRDARRGEEAARAFSAEGFEVIPLVLDVSNDASVEKAAAEVEKVTGKVHALVNCAGVFLDTDTASFLNADLETIRATLETNTYGPMRTMRAFLPLLLKSGEGRIVNVSSGMGQLSDMNGGSVGYRLSKTSLNALTRIVSDEFRSKGLLVNSVCPGWVRTDMGGTNAERDVKEGASGIVWAATLPHGGPSGGFFRDGKPIVW